MITQTVPGYAQRHLSEIDRFAQLAVDAIPPAVRMGQDMREVCSAGWAYTQPGPVALAGLHTYAFRRRANLFMSPLPAYAQAGFMQEAVLSNNTRIRSSVAWSDGSLWPDGASRLICSVAGIDIGELDEQEARAVSVYIQSGDSESPERSPFFAGVTSEQWKGIVDEQRALILDDLHEARGYAVRRPDLYKMAADERAGWLALLSGLPAVSQGASR